jgi:ATP-dependent Zn protease
MDDLVERSTERARQVLRAHADKVNALVDALLDKEELDADEVADILGQRPEPVALPEREAVAA